MLQYSMSSPRHKFIFTTTVSAGAPGAASAFLSEQTGLSRSVIKDAMNKGAVWLRRKNGKMNRLRRATASLIPGDQVDMYYDGRLLALRPPEALCLSDQRQYSVWFKPAGMLAQGTQYGDHCSLLRQAELYFRSSRKVFLVHRIDREASGVMLLAHNRDAAAKLSGLFQKKLVRKRYRIEVLGNPGGKEKRGTIDQPLEGKPSFTEFVVISYDRPTNIAVVDVITRTGRLHQIRRHFDMTGFPVIGDPKYGTGNKNTSGMKLSAVSLGFHCPFSNSEVQYSVPD
jgi:tRNA pseudouridine32 synthase/23S rRNA pseudouridine746 synthase